jgi:hypothetical protein
MSTFDKFLQNINEVQEFITSCSCCKMNKQHNYKYVKYDDDMVVHNNIMFDMRNINFNPDTPDTPDKSEWTDCALYEE